MPTIDDARAAIRDAEALLITAGAGMGVDSGLPDFRGNEGFWKAYPPIKALGLSFVEMANPRWFLDDPALAWGFYGHRLMLYRETVPHEGFAMLRALSSSMARGAFIMTSNVDGQFQRAGFPEALVCEVHGSIHHLQCLRGCPGIFSADGCRVDVDPETFRARDPLPLCPACGNLARPNVLMFGDGGWDSARTDAQEARLSSWLEGVLAARARTVVVELGAGTAIPTVRNFSEHAARSSGGLLVRINPRELQVPHGHVGLAMGALEGLRALLAPVA